MQRLSLIALFVLAIAASATAQFRIGVGKQDREWGGGIIFERHPDGGIVVGGRGRYKGWRFGGVGYIPPSNPCPNPGGHYPGGGGHYPGSRYPQPAPRVGSRYPQPWETNHPPVIPQWATDALFDYGEGTTVQDVARHRSYTLGAVSAANAVLEPKLHHQIWPIERPRIESPDGLRLIYPPIDPSLLPFGDKQLDGNMRVLGGWVYLARAFGPGTYVAADNSKSVIVQLRGNVLVATHYDGTWKIKRPGFVTQTGFKFYPMDAAVIPADAQQLNVQPPPTSLPTSRPTTR